MPEPDPLFSPEQLAMARRLFDLRVEHFRKVEEAYARSLRTIMDEAERRASLNMDYRDHVREELTKWTSMLAEASRGVDQTAEAVGEDGKAIWGQTLKDIGAFIKTTLGDLDKSEQAERDRAYFGEVEAKGKQMEGFAVLVENLKRMRH